MIYFFLLNLIIVVIKKIVQPNPTHVGWVGLMWWVGLGQKIPLIRPMHTPTRDLESLTTTSFKLRIPSPNYSQRYQNNIQDPFGNIVWTTVFVIQTIQHLLSQHLNNITRNILPNEPLRPCLGRGNGMKWKEMKIIILEYSSLPLFGSFNGRNGKLILLF